MTKDGKCWVSIPTAILGTPRLDDNFNDTILALIHKTVEN